MGATGLLRRHRAFRRLLLAQSISLLGDAFNTVALMGLVFGRTHSGTMVAWTLVAEALPGLLLAPLAGAWIDRWPRVRVLVISDLVRAALVLLFLLADRWILLALVAKALLSVASVFFVPARKALLPSLLAGADLGRANALDGIVFGAAGILGAGLGGVISAVLGHDLAFVLNALSFVLSAAVLRGLDVEDRPRPADGGPSPSLRESVRGGWSIVTHSPVVAALIAVGVSWGIVGGAYRVLLPVYALDVFDSGQTGLGLLYATQGLAVVVGGWIVAEKIGDDTRQMKRVFGLAYLAQGLFYIAFSLAGSLASGLVWLFAMRLAGGLIIPLDTTLLQREVPARAHGRVFALHAATYGSVMQLAMLATGAWLESASPARVGVTFGAVCTGVSLSWIALGAAGRLRGVEKAH